VMADLSPAAREDAMARMTEQELDILVVGGGVVGAGSAKTDKIKKKKQ